MFLIPLINGTLYLLKIWATVLLKILYLCEFIMYILDLICTERTKCKIIHMFQKSKIVYCLS